MQGAYMAEWVSTTAVADRNPYWKLELKDSLRLETWSPTLQPIVQKILNDKTLNVDDGVALFNEPNLFELG